MNPQTKIVDLEKLYENFQKIEQQNHDFEKSKMSSSLPPAGLKWIEVGPNNVGGRVRTIAINTKSKKIFAAGVSGGLWYCPTTASIETWTKVNDFYDNLNITSIAIHPADSNTMYFATG